MHENNILLFLKKIIFDISTSKQFEKIKKILIWSKEKNKNNNFKKNTFKMQKKSYFKVEWWSYYYNLDLFVMFLMFMINYWLNNIYLYNQGFKPH